MPGFMKLVLAKVGEVKGDATAKGYQGQIGIESLRSGVSLPITVAGIQPGTVAPKPAFDEVVVAKVMDRASIRLCE